jgi:glycosyltransferase involved in cell wall biosynthesis
MHDLSGLNMKGSMQQQGFTVGIDASNIRVGGGVTHLVEMLGAADPERAGVRRVVLWSSARTLNRISDRPWLCKKHVPQLDRGLAVRALWQRLRLGDNARREGCDILLVPGGLQSSDFQPSVLMSQNLLPFETHELNRYGLSWMRLKMMLLRAMQSASFRRARAVIFLSEYARDCVLAATGPLRGRTAVIPLGVNPVFYHDPTIEEARELFSEVPTRVLYVSVVDVYKHQWHVIQAVGQLRREGLAVTLDLVGAGARPSLERMNRVLDEVDPGREFIRYRGVLPHDALPSEYRSAHICVFASSCENLPNILLESMAAGRPIACSNRGPMTEVLRDGGVFFDPESPSSIAASIKELMASAELRAQCAQRAYQLAQRYSWRKCADCTFELLAQAIASSRALPTVAKGLS